MLENRKKVIYTGLAILVSMTSNICTFPIYAKEECPQKSVDYTIQLNGNMDQQIKKIIVEKMQEENPLKEISNDIQYITEKEDARYYVWDTTLIKVDKVNQKVGSQELVMGYAQIQKEKNNDLENNFEEIQMDRQMVVEIKKEDTESPIIELKKKDITLTTNDSFDPNQYILNVEDNVDQMLGVKIQNDVDTTTPGIYSVIYSAVDNSGNKTEETLSVKVNQGIDYAAIARAAKKQIGNYQDCTMLVTNSLRSAGINFHGAPYEYASLGKYTNNPVPGDICIYNGHVAIYIGNGKAIHGGFDGTTVESTVACSNAFIGYIHIKDNK